MASLTEEMERLAEQARDLRSRRQELWQELIESVRELREEATALVTKARRKRREMATQARKDRGAFMDELRGNVETLVADARDARLEGAADGRDARQGFMDEVMASVEAARSGARDLCNAFREAFAGAAAADAESRAESIAHIRDLVASLKRSGGSRPSHPFGKDGEQRRQAPDDLTAIQGIGPKTQERLHALGIDSFAVLAEADPDELAAGLAGRGGGAKRVRKWVAAAEKKRA
ncbi:MAG: helix-hairpin-helix domain-containing protein [Planctomycetota bacterium]